MQLIQYKGPFSRGQNILVPMNDDYRYVHIGLQVPYKWKLEYLADNDFAPDIRINNGKETFDFWINQRRILEFDGMADSYYYITFLKSLPMETIVDIIHRDIDNA